MTLSTAEIYRQKESSSLSQTAKFIFSRLLDSCEVFELGDLLNDIKTGKTPSKNEKKYYEDEFIDWFKPNEIGDKKYLEKAESKLSKFAYDKGQVTVYKANSILINAIGDVGRIAILKHEASSNQQITGIELNEEKLLTEYCYYYLLANRHHFYKDLFQTTLPIVNQKKIKLIPIPVPNLEEQKRIVAFLDKLENINSIDELKEIIGFDDLIGVAEKFYVLKNKNSEISTELTHQLDLVKQLRQAFLREAMQGKLVPQDPSDEPASLLLEKIKAEKERLIKEKVIRKGKLQEAETLDELLFDIPDHWVWCKLDSICKNITDGTHQTPTYTKSGRMFLSAQNVKPFRFMPEEHKFVSEEAYQGYIKNRKPERGDLLIGRVGAGIGETAVIDQDLDFCIYVSLGLVQPFKEYVDSNYLAYVFNSPYGYSYAKGNISSKGGSAGNFNLGRIRSFLIPFPPLSEQQRIVTKLDELMQYCDELEASIKESQQQNELLLQQVLREALESQEREVVE